MKFYDIVYNLAHDNGMNIEDLSRKLGRGARYVGGAKSRGSLPKIDNAVMIVNACGCAICAIPSDNIPEDAIVIDFE